MKAERAAILATENRPTDENLNDGSLCTAIKSSELYDDVTSSFTCKQTFGYGYAWASLPQRSVTVSNAQVNGVSLAIYQGDFVPGNRYYKRK